MSYTYLYSNKLFLKDSVSLLYYLLQCCHKGLFFVCFFTNNLLETAFLNVSKLFPTWRFPTSWEWR